MVIQLKYVFSTNVLITIPYQVMFCFEIQPFPMLYKDWLTHLFTSIHIYIRARENRKNSRSGPKLRILDRFQTPQNANKSVQQVCALNSIFPQPTNFHESMVSKKSQTVKSSQTDNVRAPFKCDIMVLKRL